MPRGYWRRSGARTAWLVVLTAALTTLLFAATVLLRDEAAGQVFWIDVVLYNLPHLAAVVALWRTGSAADQPAIAWRLIAAGEIATIAGNLYFSLVADPDAYVTLADPAYLLSYPLTYVGIMLLLRTRVHWRPVMWFDGLVAGLGASAVASIVLTPALAPVDVAPKVALVLAAYPVSDLLLVIVVVGGLSLVRLRDNLDLILLAASMFAWFVGDALYFWASMGEGYAEGGVIDLCYLLSATLMTLPAVAGRVGARTPDDSGGRTSIVLPVSMVVVSLCVLAVALHSSVSGVSGWLALAAVGAGMGRSVLTMKQLRDAADHRHQARTDELTNLSNRRALSEECDRLLSSATSEQPLCLLMFDLDRFKEVNDSLGHAVGDDLLVLVAERLRALTRPGDVLARLGGDEFALLLPATQPADAVAIGRRALASMTASHTLGETTVQVGVSIGVASAPWPARDRSELMRAADVAMYEAKRAEAGIREFDADLTQLNRLTLMEHLRRAVSSDGVPPQANPSQGSPSQANPSQNSPSDLPDAGRLVVHLQPQVPLSVAAPTGEQGAPLIVGVEALMRWQHPTEGMLPPAVILPLAEAAGLMGLVAERVLELALAACAKWWLAGVAVPVSVNLSAANVKDLGLPDKVALALDRAGLPPAALVVELTEDTLMNDPVRASDVLQELQRSGVRISIDDFGTGYASLAYLRDFPVDELKLDRSFVSDVLASATTETIVTHTIELAHALGVSVVAEGIEDAEIAFRLAALGCERGQGFLFSGPVEAATLVAMLTSSQVAAPSPALTP